MSELRPVPGYPGFCVTIDGQVRSPWGHWRKHSVKPHGHHYISTNTGPEGKQRNLYIHHAVALAWVGPQPEGMEICHNDGDPSNNHASNLRWDTHGNNMRDCRKHDVGTLLLASDIPTIRERLARGEKQHVIAEDYGVHKSTIGKIHLGINWVNY